MDSSQSHIFSLGVIDLSLSFNERSLYCTLVRVVRHVRQIVLGSISHCSIQIMINLRKKMLRLTITYSTNKKNTLADYCNSNYKLSELAQTTNTK
jgi:hypothetical protein